MPSEIYSGRDMSQQLSGATINPNAAGLGNGTFYGPDGKAYSVKNGDASNNYFGNVRWTGGSPGRQTPGAVMQYGAGKSWANLPDQLYTGYNPAAGLTGAINPSTAGIGDGTFYDATGKVYNVQNGNASNNNFGNVRWAGTSHPGKGPEFAHLQYLNNGNWEDVPDELYTGTTTEHQGGFDDAVFNKRKQAYVDYAMPQLQDQYADQRKALTYALSRGGNLGSSLAASKSAALNKDYSLQQQSVYDTGQDYVNKAKSEMAQQKANLVSMLQATADPDAVANVAQSQVAAASAMPTFSPLSPVISNVASGLGTYLSNQQTADAIRKATGGDSYTNSLSRTSGKVG
jgi:hypothetical protein